MPVERTSIIATVNFKGGVGKTTLTWLLAKCASQEDNVLVIDADAQMSLTTAIESAEETGQWVSKDFKEWFEHHKGKKKTLFDAIDKFTDASGKKDLCQHFSENCQERLSYLLSDIVSLIVLHLFLTFLIQS